MPGQHGLNFRWLGPFPGKPPVLWRASRPAAECARESAGLRISEGKADVGKRRMTDSQQPPRPREADFVHQP